MIHLRVSRSLVRAEVLGPGAPWAAEAAFATPGELADAIARLAAEAPRNGKRVRMTVALEPPLVQVRSLADLPPVKPADLATLVAAQSSRFFRRNGSALVTDATWETNGDGPRVARAAAADEPWLEAIAAGARTAGGALYAARLVVGLRQTKRELARLARPAAAVLAARRDLRDASALIETLNQAAAQREVVAARLGRISPALPDSAFLTSLTLDASGSGVLTGLARRAADVVARLEARGAVAHPRLDGPVLRERTAGRDWERFTILFGRESR